MIFGIVLIVAGIGIAASSGGAHHTHGHANVHVTPPPAHVVHVAGPQGTRKACSQAYARKEATHAKTYSQNKECLQAKAKAKHQKK